MIIGILNEPGSEKRVALLPEHLSAFNAKNEFLVEKGIGDQGLVSEESYQEFKAVVADRNEIFQKSDMILCINPPQAEELSKIKKETVLVGVLNPLGDFDIVKAYKNEGLTSFSMDLIPRITRAQSMDILSSMATIAGYKAVLSAALHLPRFFPMFMSAAGTIKPAKVLILGAGVAGLQAIAISRKLGAIVEVFDVRSAVKDEVMSLGGKFIEVEGATEDKAAGGYAVEQTEEFKQKQAQLIHNHAIGADVIIATAQIPGRKAPVLIKAETIASMKAGSVIVDLAASTGGNCEGTVNNETVTVNNVKIIGNSNLPSEMAIDASKMFGNNLTKFLKLILTDEGTMNLDFEDEIVKGTCLTHKGEVMNERVKSLVQ